MGLIGREIIQSVAYDDPNAKKPNLNYRETFPITVFDAVRQSMSDPDSKTLQDMLDLLFQQLNEKQPIFKAMPANYIMTFAGIPGAVGSIKITQEIPWDPSQQSQERIPTEKAVGDLMFKLGLIDQDGNPINDPESKHVRWSDVIGRPLMYTDTGQHEDGFMTQKAVTDLFKQMEIKMEDIGDLSAAKVETFIEKLNTHASRMDNPHAVTIEQIGAVSKEALRFHVEDAINPHGITAELIGLGNVDNTRDEDKPLSAATREAIVKLNESIAAMGNSIGGLDFITDASYNQESGQFTLTFKSGNSVVLHIPINGLIDEIGFDADTKEIVFYEIGGEIKRVDVSSLFLRYIGSEGTEIVISIDGTQETGDQIIKAEIKNGSITANKFADGALGTTVFADQSITADKIKDLTITTIKLADGSITTEKITEKAITSSRLDDRSVTGRTIFSSPLPNRVLAVYEANTDPIWSLIQGAMIDDGAIQTRHILNFNITPEKLAERSVTTSKLENQAVTHDKLAVNAVRSENIIEHSIPGSKLAIGVMMPGTPLIEVRPHSGADNNQIPDTHWVRETIGSSVLTHDNIGPRAVDGSNLFSSEFRNRVLIVGRAQSDPVWGQINSDMMGIDSVITSAIKDLAVTSDKIAEKAIDSRHFGREVIKADHIGKGAITTDRILNAPGKGYVIGSIDSSGNIIHTKVMEDMMAPNAIGTMAIQDNSVTPAKVQTSSDGAVVLGVNLKNTSPMWMKITSKMIADRAVDGHAIFSSPIADRVLITNAPGTDPIWGTISSPMISSMAVKQEHIAAASITSEHLQESIIEGKHLAPWSIPGNRITPRTITGAHLFTSEYPHRILGVTDPYTDPQWMQVSTEMIEDNSITKEKMMYSENPYRVIGATQAGVPPEYLMITHQFIVDGTIIGTKLDRNIALQGTPEMTVHPAIDADNYQIATTKWVRKIVQDTAIDILTTLGVKDVVGTGSFGAIPGVEDSPTVDIDTEECGCSTVTDKVVENIHARAFNCTIPEGITTEEILNEKPTTENDYTACGCGSGSGGASGGIPTLFRIAPNSITGRHLFTHPYGPRVLGITAPNEDVEFLLVEEGLIADGAVTTNKLQRDIHLLGRPVLEVRPSPIASTQYGGGNLIPDCQWVLDRIAEAAATGLGAIKNMREITPEQVRFEWDTKGTSPDELEDEDDYPIEGAPTTVPGYGTSGSSGSSTSTESVKISDKVVVNIHNTAYNDTQPELDPSSDPKVVYPTNENDYKGISTGGSSNEGGGIGILMPDIIETIHLQDRSITGAKLFTSPQSHMVLAVKGANTDPEYTKIYTDLLEDRSVDGHAIFSSDASNRVLVVGTAGSDPLWGLITAAMMGAGSVKTDAIYDGAVTHEKLAKGAIDASNLKDQPIVSEIHIQDTSVTAQKLADRSVTPDKIAKRAVKAEHIEEDVELPGHPTVAPDTHYETRSLRNIILSPNPPTNTGNTGFSNGDIWFQYI